MSDDDTHKPFSEDLLWLLLGWLNAGRAGCDSSRHIREGKELEWPFEAVC